MREDISKVSAQFFQALSTIIGTRFDRMKVPSLRKVIFIDVDEAPAKAELKVHWPDSGSTTS